MILFILLISMLYLTVAGGAGKQIHQLGSSRCNRKVHDWEHCSHYYTGIMGGMFWPIALPIGLGMKSSDAIPTPISKEVKAEQARESELKEIQHRAQVEQALVMEDEMLSRRLELTVKHAEQEKRLLELNAAGVDTDSIRTKAGL